MCILQTSAECELYILDTFSVCLHKNGPLLQPHNIWCNITWIWLHPVSHDCYWALVMLLKPAIGGRVLLVLVGCFIQFLPSIYFLHIYIAVRYFMWRGARLSLHPPASPPSPGLDNNRYRINKLFCWSTTNLSATWYLIQTFLFRNFILILVSTSTATPHTAHCHRCQWMVIFNILLLTSELWVHLHS